MPLDHPWASSWGAPRNQRRRLGAKLDDAVVAVHCATRAPRRFVFRTASSSTYAPCSTSFGTAARSEAAHTRRAAPTMAKCFDMSVWRIDVTTTLRICARDRAGMGNARAPQPLATDRLRILRRQMILAEDVVLGLAEDAVSRVPDRASGHRALSALHHRTPPPRRHRQRTRDAAQGRHRRCAGAQGATTS